MPQHSINTLLVHTGERAEAPLGQAVATPIYTSSTYTYESMSDLNAAFSGEGGDYTYSRNGNPTVSALEDVMAVIENGKAAVAFGSGMAAIHAALMACDLAPGSVVLASQDLYGASFALLHSIFGPFGVRTEVADFNDLEHLRIKIADTKPLVLLAETISNPLLKVCDLAAVAGLAHDGGARLLVDNTFASPFLCRPLDLGADLVAHSTTKYLSGHGDSMGGVVISASETERDSLIKVRKLAGGVLSTWEAHEIVRGIKTLGLRQERQCENATVVADKLAGHAKVEKVYFPKLSADASLAARVLREPHGGALVTIKLVDDTRDGAFRFMDSLRLCVRATSLGDVQTLVSHPATSSHRELNADERVAVGITEGMVRISVGIEDAADLIADIEQALDR